MVYMWFWGNDLFKQISNHCYIIYINIFLTLFHEEELICDIKTYTIMHQKNNITFVDK